VTGSSLFGQHVRLYTNVPTSDAEFDRKQYQELTFQEQRDEEDGSGYAQLRLTRPGSFRYYVRLNSDDDVKDEDKHDKDAEICGYFLVEPLLSVGPNAFLELNSIRCQTYLSKCLGYFENWKEKLEVAYRSGYNAIHFTPIQELGASKSAYSLKNHQTLNPSFNFENSSSEYSFDDIARLVENMRQEWGIVSFTDIVLNHTANETPWLQEHPESAYNLQNSPHLRPAYLLDRLLWHVSLDIDSGKWESSGLPKELKTEDHLNRLRDILKNNYLPLVRIAEMFLVDIDAKCHEFEQLLQSYANGTYKTTAGESEADDDQVHIIQDQEYRRFGCSVNMNCCVRQAISGRAGRDLQDWLWCSASSFRSALIDLNGRKSEEIQHHLNCAIENVLSAVRYERIDANGPKLQLVSTQHPLVPQYFTHPGSDTELASEEEIVYDSTRNQFVMAHNGWVMGDDVLRNFAGADSNVYLRRELVAWGDSVKLRYGRSPDDSPFLWQYMRSYVQQTAQIFHGVRLDNCHSTPLEVAEYLIDAARRVRPNLFVIAELFTSSEYLDNIFVNRLGINSLIRESLNCPDSHELGRVLHRFGGNPVGAFDHQLGSSTFDCKPLQPTLAHAILFDQTHDNESSFRVRTAFDLLPSAALVSMSCSAVGSNRGYDELVSHHIHVVNERRVYTYWNDEPTESKSAARRQVNYDKGILQARLLLNRLHGRLSQGQFGEIFVDQVDGDTVAVTRFNPNTLKSIVLIARTAFKATNFEDHGQHIRSIEIAGRIQKVLFEMRMKGSPDKYRRDDFIINGVSDFVGHVRSDLTLEQMSFVRCRFDADKVKNQVEFVHFKPGSVIAFEVEQDESSIEAVQRMQSYAQQLCCRSDTVAGEIQRNITDLDLNALNYVLFRSNQEEADDGLGGGAYDIPKFKTLNFCGLAGLMFYWRDIRTKNDLGHPICDNLRQGLWLPQYIVTRLQRKEATRPLGDWLQVAFKELANIPNYLVPRYFDLIVTPLYNALLQQCWQRCSSFVSDGNRLIQLLTFGSIALLGYNRTSPLPPISNRISSPLPQVEASDGTTFPACVTIAAGLTHFASGYMRNWGRDTFIALRGLCLTTGRHDEARYIILGFAGVLRHGLIPNLLDRGTNARYNCRDAVWWWLQSIKDYCEIIENGVDILDEPVNRLYPTDDSPPILDFSVQERLCDTIQEAVNRHFVGIDFVERNAGKQIDEHMQEPGFHVKAGVCRRTGFVYGGNPYNCGTWMDKMGSSVKAGNDGRPATPRDGSAVELVGLCCSVVGWLADLHQSGRYTFDGVTHGDEHWSWRQWHQRLIDSFESNFWVSDDDLDPLINKRHIYKDSLNSSELWRDFQLRPNFLVAMTVAPRLFNVTHARLALDTIESTLVSRLGMRTLDPTDWNYHGDYINSDSSDQFSTANGFNYHNGPEWLWPVGFYLRARLRFFDDDPDLTRRFVRGKLIAHYQHLEQSDWFGLPELTNSNGKYCADSCVLQAWSHATLLDTLYDMRKPSSPALGAA
jgi:glycogen debranching enzyme